MFRFALINLIYIGLSFQYLAAKEGAETDKEMINIKSCLEMKMEFDRVIDIKQVLVFKSTISNRCRKNLHIYIGPMPFDITITDDIAGKSWQWSQYHEAIKSNKYLTATLPILNIVELAPGMSHQFSINWDFFRGPVKATPSANYTVQGKLELIDVLINGKRYGRQFIVSKKSNIGTFRK